MIVLVGALVLFAIANANATLVFDANGCQAPITGRVHRT
jgi:hypothetical protein